jgi:Sulfocyanin (SoxE) domain
MSISLCTRRPERFLIGALILAGSACSKSDDQRATAGSETASVAIGAPDTVTSSPDTAMNGDSGKNDTSAAREHTTSPSVSPAGRDAQASSPVTTDSAKPRVRPNIDPGRISTKPKSSVPTNAAGSDSVSRNAAPAQVTASSSSSPSADPKDSTLTYEASSNTVTFQLIGGPAGFQFNGHSGGSATLTVPPKANVVINFINKDGTPHSAEVIPGEGPIPNSGGDAAIPKAYTNQLLQGLPQEGTDVIRFTVPGSGSYRIFCGVPGHGLSGMWIWMKVDPAAKAPSFGPTKS